MKVFVALSFFLLAVAVSGKPGGYTASNDVLNLKLDDATWADAKRAGEPPIVKRSNSFKE